MRQILTAFFSGFFLLHFSGVLIASCDFQNENFGEVEFKRPKSISGKHKISKFNDCFVDRLELRFMAKTEPEKTKVVIRVNGELHMTAVDIPNRDLPYFITVNRVIKSLVLEIEGDGEIFLSSVQAKFDPNHKNEKIVSIPGRLMTLKGAEVSVFNNRDSRIEFEKYGISESDFIKSIHFESEGIADSSWGQIYFKQMGTKLANFYVLGTPQHFSVQLNTKAKNLVLMGIGQNSIQVKNISVEYVKVAEFSSK